MEQIDKKGGERSCYVIYDGECPLCLAYVRFMRLKMLVGEVELIDARKQHKLLTTALRNEFDLNDGMLVILDGHYFYGADAVNKLSLLTGPSGTLNRILYRMLQNPRSARLIYPFLRTGRNVTLRLLGRSKIGV